MLGQFHLPVDSHFGLVLGLQYVRRQVRDLAIAPCGRSRRFRAVYSQDSQIGRKLDSRLKMEVSLDAINVERRPVGADCALAVGQSRRARQ
jgi:hypothetical protein